MAGVDCHVEGKKGMKDFLGGFALTIALVGCSLVGVFIIYFFVTGGAKIAVIVLPWLHLASCIILAIFGMVLMPLSYFRRTKAIAGVGMVIASNVFGLTLWLWGFLLTYAFWGMVAVIAGLFMGVVGVVPIAMLAVLINAEWYSLTALVILIVLTFGVGCWGCYLLERAKEDSGKASDIGVADVLL